MDSTPRYNTVYKCIVRRVAPVQTTGKSPYTFDRPKPNKYTENYII